MLRMDVYFCDIVDCYVVKVFADGMLKYREAFRSKKDAIKGGTDYLSR